jgi:hypothetical protein
MAVTANIFGSAGFSAKNVEPSRAKGTVALRSQFAFASHALFTGQYLNADACE